MISVFLLLLSCSEELCSSFEEIIFEIRLLRWAPPSSVLVFHRATTQVGKLQAYIQMHIIFYTSIVRNKINNHL